MFKISKRSSLLVMVLALATVVSLSSTTYAFSFFGLFDFGSNEAENTVSVKEVRVKLTLPLKTDVTKQINRVKAYKRINQLRHEEDINFIKIEKIYDKYLEGMVKSRDKEFNQTMNPYIEAAFNGVKNGRAPQIGSQIIDKTLKKAFYLTVKHELVEAIKEIEESKEAHHKLDEAIVYYQVLSNMIKEENKKVNQNIISGLKTARQAINKNNPGKLRIAAQIVDKNIIKAYHDVILHEVEEVEEYDSTDPAEAKIEKLEGLYYYQAIKDKVKPGNKIGSKMIEKQLTGPSIKVKYNPISNELNRGFVAKVFHELEEVEEEWGKPEASVKAWEALLYYNIVHDNVKEKLGADKAKNLLTDLRTLTKAVANGDKIKVKELEAKVKSQLRNYIGQI
ncbi:hypothetical protein Halha_0803 [Halobacteroides halobius DSM 5150]|uniref:Uncharacterized protein n=1 Tax=Halobacteroides halobius (strain ATCC 35273 / DSM 5150 / MD-1) TaxID=748449 RepID=L0K8U6_HALHC|nr:hypothetical protein [Halobacteroides halobius]AGB40774.1 hypothetical protein Halha_0803 [Halobacteroides halobius DSM 5150]